jgi:hypothetical protein
VTEDAVLAKMSLTLKSESVYRRGDQRLYPSSTPSDLKHEPSRSDFNMLADVWLVSCSLALHCSTVLCIDPVLAGEVLTLERLGTCPCRFCQVTFS